METPDYSNLPDREIIQRQAVMIKELNTRLETCRQILQGGLRMRRFQNLYFNAGRTKNDLKASKREEIVFDGNLAMLVRREFLTSVDKDLGTQQTIFK